MKRKTRLRPWTAAEVEIVRTNSISEAWRKLSHRSRSAIKTKRARMDTASFGEIFSLRRKWTGEEDAAIWNARSADEALRLLPHRSYDAIKVRRSKIGCPSWVQAWTAAEDDALRSGACRLPNRTPVAVYVRRHVLGVSTPRPESWSEDEVAELRRTGQCPSRGRDAYDRKRQKLEICARRHRASPELIQSAVPRTLPREVRDEVIADFLVAAAEGRLSLDMLSAAGVREASNAVYRRYHDRWGALSLDTEIPGTDGLRLGDRLVDHSERFDAFKDVA